MFPPKAGGAVRMPPGVSLSLIRVPRSGVVSPVSPSIFTTISLSRKSGACRTSSSVLTSHSSHTFLRPSNSTAVNPGKLVQRGEGGAMVLSTVRIHGLYAVVEQRKWLRKLSSLCCSFDLSFVWRMLISQTTCSYLTLVSPPIHPYFSKERKDG